MPTKSPFKSGVQPFGNLEGHGDVDLQMIASSHEILQHEEVQIARAEQGDKNHGSYISHLYDMLLYLDGDNPRKLLKRGGYADSSTPKPHKTLAKNDLITLREYAFGYQMIEKDETQKMNFAQRKDAILLQDSTRPLSQTVSKSGVVNRIVQNNWCDSFGWTHCGLVDKSGRLLAMIMAEVTAENGKATLDLDSIFVPQDLRQEGLTRALMSQVISEAAKALPDHDLKVTIGLSANSQKRGNEAVYKSILAREFNLKEGEEFVITRNQDGSIAFQIPQVTKQVLLKIEESLKKDRAGEGAGFGEKAVKIVNNNILDDLIDEAVNSLIAEPQAQQLLPKKTQSTSKT